MLPNTRRTILTATIIVLALGAEAGYVILTRQTAAAPSFAPGSGRYQNLSAGIVQDPRFRKLSMAHIAPVQVGKTGRENPFLPTEALILPPSTSSTEPLSTTSTP